MDNALEKRLRAAETAAHMHVDADTLRKVIETLVQSELVVAAQLAKGGIRSSNVQ